MVRAAALYSTSIVMIGLVAYLATGSAIGKILNTKRDDNRPQHTRSNNCEIELAGRFVHLQIGQGIRTVDGWRNCQAYDGHSFIVYSTKPPKSVAIEDNG
jgi:hypothetical protein